MGIVLLIISRQVDTDLRGGIERDGGSSGNGLLVIIFPVVRGILNEPVAPGAEHGNTSIEALRDGTGKRPLGLKLIV